VQAWSFIQHHRSLSVVFLAIIVFCTAGGTCWAVFFRTVASPVSLRAALRLYKRDQSARTIGTVSSAFGLTPGVFAYRTTGGETLSLLDQSRAFPARTSFVVSRAAGACSAAEWVPLVQHTETTTACPGAGHSLVVSNFVTFEQISGTTTTTLINCPATAYLLPPSAQPGARWSAVCRQVNPAENVTLDGVVLAPATLAVGSHRVPTVHVRLTLSFAGAVNGTSPTDYWISVSRGLIVRQQEVARIVQGGIHYSEHMDTQLSSLTPAR
jgi:hypothetical protein